MQPDCAGIFIPKQMKYQTIQFQGKTIHFRSRGDGETVVLLHGFLESLNIWETFGQELARDFHVITIDLPGHGQSDTLAESHPMELMAEVVHDVLLLNHVDRCMMLGHSMGGYVTMAFASMYPEMLSGICLFHSGALEDTGEAKANRLRTIEIVKKNRQHFISQFIPDLFTPENRELFRPEIERIQEEARLSPAEGIIAAQSGMKDRRSQLDTLVNARFPVLFVGGKQDPRIPVDRILAQSALPKHSEVLLLDGCGHMGHIEATGTTLKAVKFFAERVLY